MHCLQTPIQQPGHNFETCWLAYMYNSHDMKYNIQASKQGFYSHLRGNRHSIKHNCVQNWGCKTVFYCNLIWCVLNLDLRAATYWPTQDSQKQSLTAKTDFYLMGPKAKEPCKRYRLDSGYSEAPDTELGQQEPAATPLASLPSSDSYPDQDSFYDCEPVTLGHKSGLMKMAIVAFIIYTISIGLAAHVGYKLKSDSEREASFVVQVGGWGDRPTTEIEELYRPGTPACKNNQRKVLDLPVPLRAHIAIQVDGFGLLVEERLEKNRQFQAKAAMSSSTNWEPGKTSTSSMLQGWTPMSCRLTSRSTSSADPAPSPSNLALTQRKCWIWHLWKTAGRWGRRHTASAPNAMKRLSRLPATA